MAIITGNNLDNRLIGTIGNDEYRFPFAQPQGNNHWSGVNFGNDTIAASPYNANDLIVADNIQSVTTQNGDLILKVWDFAYNSAEYTTITLENWMGCNTGQRIHRVAIRDGYRPFGNGNNRMEYYLDVDLSGGGALQDFSGSNRNRMFFAWNGDDTVKGGAGKDWLDGGSGNDFLSGGGNDDDLQGGAGNDTLLGGTGNDYIKGSTGNDVISGGVGNDMYRLGNGDASYNGDIFGNDTLLADGANGNDTLVLRNMDAPQYATRSGNDLVLHFMIAGLEQTFTLQGWYASAANQIKNVRYRDDHLLKIDMYGKLSAGTDGADVLNFSGNTANQFVFGLSGNDKMTGGSGNDFLCGDAGNDLLTGGAGNDMLTGGSGNDTLNGETGNDSMSGGLGNDLYYVDAAKDAVTESVAAGTDSVRTTLATYTLGANVENLIFTGTGKFRGTGNVLNNSITGGAGNDTLSGGTGNDTLNGGAGNDSLVGGTGNDSYYVDNAGDVVTEAANAGTDTVLSTVTRTLGSNFENLTLTGTGNINGTGNTLNNLLKGNSGANTLDGLTGNDKLYGYAGNDVLTGGVGSDTLDGGVGNDVYNYGFATPGNGTRYLGAFGNDVIVAGNANAGDRLIVDNIDGNFSSGNDLVLKIWDQASGDYAGNITLQNWLLADTGQRIHQVTVRGGYYQYFGGGNSPINYYFDVDHTGSNTKNFTGNNTNQMYYGWSGNDTITGGGGSDLLYGDRGNDTVSGGAGDDNVYGGNDNDRLSGGAGNDCLRGGSGNDTLTGGAGNDVYRFGSGSVYNGEAFGNDVIIGDANDILYLRNTDGPTNVYRNGNNLVFGFAFGAGNNPTVTLQNWFTNPEAGKLRTVRFSNNFTGHNYLAGLDVLTNLADTKDYDYGTVSSYTQNLWVCGLGGNDTINGGNGSDYISGGNDQDRLSGEAGSDTLYGGAGNDILTGGAGNDSLVGEAGVDCYSFSGSFGHDWIGIDGVNPNSQDKVEFAGLKHTQVTGALSGNDLVLTYGSGNNVTLDDWNASASNRLNTFQFTDGVYGYNGTGWKLV